MNVFDFDKTVYLHESGSRFFRYCARRYPLVLLWLPVAGVFGLGRLLRLWDLARFKAATFGFLRVLPQAEEMVERFWDQEQGETPTWLAELLPQGGLVISASPEFLVAGLCRRLGLDCMGTRMDIRNGHVEGANCKGAEKVRRFRAVYPDADVNAFYSDSLSDSPMAALAQRAYLVQGNRLSPWPQAAFCSE